MNIFDFAMQMEKDGEDYYREMAQKVSDIGMKNILTLLANDEVKHFKTLEAMKAQEEPGMVETKVLSGVKNIFAKMKEKNERIDIQESQKSLWEKALEIEHKSEEFYTTESDKVKSAHQKDMLLKIAEEERKHIFLIENVINFISRPRQWVENAEFNHLDEY